MQCTNILGGRLQLVCTCHTVVGALSRTVQGVALPAGTLAQATSAICGGSDTGRNSKLAVLRTSWYCEDGSLIRPLITSLLPSLLLTTWQSLIMPIAVSTPHQKAVPSPLSLKRGLILEDSLVASLAVLTLSQYSCCMLDAQKSEHDVLLEETASTAIAAELSRCCCLCAAVLPGTDGGQVGVMQQSGPQNCLPLLHLGEPLSPSCRTLMLSESHMYSTVL